MLKFIKKSNLDDISDESEEEKDDRWTCNQCTFYNKASSKTCEICNYKRPKNN